MAGAPRQMTHRVCQINMAKLPTTYLFRREFLLISITKLLKQRHPILYCRNPVCAQPSMAAGKDALLSTGQGTCTIEPTDTSENSICPDYPKTCHCPNSDCPSWNNDVWLQEVFKEARQDPEDMRHFGETAAKATSCRRRIPYYSALGTSFVRFGTADGSVSFSKRQDQVVNLGTVCRVWSWTSVKIKAAIGSLQVRLLKEYLEMEKGVSGDLDENQRCPSQSDLDETCCNSHEGRCAPQSFGGNSLSRLCGLLLLFGVAEYYTSHRKRS